MEFEDVLVKIGDFGSYQKMLIPVVLFPAAVILPWYGMNLFFVAIVPDHWCNVPELVSTNLTIAERQNLIRPVSDPKCKMYDVNYTEIIMSSNWTISPDTETKFCDHGWEYDKTHYYSTAATKFDMVCNDSYYVSILHNTADIATIIGTPIYGALADKFGRRPVFFLTVVVTTSACIASVFVPDVVGLLVLKTLEQTVMPTVYQILNIIVMELVGPDKRSVMNAATNVLWTVGVCSLPLVVWLTHGWVTLGITVSCFSVIFLIYLKVLPESPRWLASQERYDEAAAILFRIAERNGKNVNRDDLIADMKKVGERAIKQKKEESTKKFSRYILKYPKLRKHFLIISLAWSAYGTAYFGLHLNTVNLSGNEMFNYFLLGLVEFPGLLCSWYCLEKIGRRWWSVSCLFITGLSCLMPCFIPEEMTAGNTVASIIGKFGASAGFMALYQQSSELYPTVHRSAGLGLSGTAAGLLNLAIPYIVYASRYGKFIPFLTISCLCFSAGVASAFLPETLNENLPQTLEDSEEFGKDQKFFSWHGRKRPRCHEEKPSGVSMNLN